MRTPADIIATYIRAKDGNRPHLMAEAFAETAVLEMIVKTGAISFPPRTIGLTSIADVLVGRFGQTFENVYTLCLAPPPAEVKAFDCDWLVGMSEKTSGAVLVGCGRYEWQFSETDPPLAQRLVITVEKMEVLPGTTLAPVMRWLSNLPYPWCPAERAAASTPDFTLLSTIVAFMDRRQ